MTLITQKDRATLITDIETNYIRGDVTDAQWADYLDEALVHAVRLHDWVDLFQIGDYPTAINTRTVSLNPQIRTLYRVQYIDPTTANNSRDVKFMEQDRFLDMYVAESMTPTNPPEHWTYWGKKMLLGPTPDAIANLETFESRFPTSFSTGTLQQSDILHVDDYLIAWAVYRAFKRFEQDDAAAAWRIVADEHINSAIKLDNKLFPHHSLKPLKGYELTPLT